jgi:hypothetical protein
MPNGRNVQIDLQMSGSGPFLWGNPNEGGPSDEFGPEYKSKLINWLALPNENPPAFVSVVQIADWHTGKLTEWYIIRRTELIGSVVSSHFILCHGYPIEQQFTISYDWYFDPRWINREISDAGDCVRYDTNFVTSQDGISDYYGDSEGSNSLAVSVSTLPNATAAFHVDSTLADAAPRCFFAGLRDYDLKLPPQKKFVGWQITAIGQGVQQSRQRLVEYMSQKGLV